MKLQFQPDMPDHPNVQWEQGAVIFHLHAKPIKFGPYPDIATAYEAFNELIASTQINPTLRCDECGDDKLADDTGNGNPGWWRCDCGGLHKPHGP